MLSKLTQRSAVLRAIAEHDDIGRKAFLKKYGFSRARSFILIHDEKPYDSKAIAGVAYQNQFGESLGSSQFSGGERTVRLVLEKLGFAVKVRELTDATASSLLGEMLTRVAAQLGIRSSGSLRIRPGGRQRDGSASVDLYARFMTGSGEGLTFGILEGWTTPAEFQMELRERNTRRYGLRTWPISMWQAAESALVSELKRILALGPLVSNERDWSDAENEAIVRAYFDLLRAELLGEKVNKRAAYRAVAPILNARTRGAIEFKLANISAILNGRGLPIVAGLQPRTNAQTSLSNAVSNQLTAWDGDSSLPELEASGVLPTPTIEDLVEEPRPTGGVIRPAEPGKPAQRRPIDYAAREQRKSAIGVAGEKFALQEERRRLQKAGRPDLAERVRHVSAEEGDGAGYDVLSFDTDGMERWLEVKTTTRGKSEPFFLSATELETARAHADRYIIYRLFEFGELPRLYLVRNVIANIQVQACAFIAVCK